MDSKEHRGHTQKYAYFVVVVVVLDEKHGKKMVLAGTKIEKKPWFV